jgi:hypothetical protein
VYDRVGFLSVIGPLLTFEVEEILRVVKQCDIVVVHFRCILVSEEQILSVQLCSLST